MEHERTTILNVEYHHRKVDNADMYLTEFGMPLADILMPGNFLTDEAWFKNNSTRLSGTSCLYKVRTKDMQGQFADIVLKWNRMGMAVPVDTYMNELANAEFNSPFEEFSLVMELRDAVRCYDIHLALQKPLAIYVPRETVELWQSGREEYRMNYKIASHKEIALDMNRSYAVIYQWLPGMDAAVMCEKQIISAEEMERITVEMDDMLRGIGFLVRDRKPHHIILKPDEKEGYTRDASGMPVRALIDYELLAHTSENDAVIKRQKRQNYLKRQRDRFTTVPDLSSYPHLKQVSIFGVDYVYGHAESTEGRLWVVGRDPLLFDYFLPERWENTPKTKISMTREIYHTVTKDNIHIVWKLSHAGMKPDMDPSIDEENKILQYGYNSPFEEISIALELTEKGIFTIYPRAVYMAGSHTAIPEGMSDMSRYQSHAPVVMPDGNPLFTQHHDYISIWGYWNGPDEKLAAIDDDYYEGIDALRALRKGVITEEVYRRCIEIIRERLSLAGIEDLSLRGNHLLLSFDSKGRLITGNEGVPDIRISNFEFLKRRINRAQ
ncbi:MAG: hypothetical protein AABZ39_13040 [Spirochaetota bacterium]